MVENVEKKIVAGIIVVGTAVALGAAFVMQKKTAAEKLEQMETYGAPIVESPHQPAVPIDSSASSEIAVGGPKKENSKPSAKVKGLTEVTWEDLYKLDYKTGKAPDSLKKLHKTKIRMPGFIVPLSDDLTSLKEFLLVPNAQACIHVPPPPPNLIVYVVLEKSLPISKVSNPSWIEGTLLIETTESEYGAASYKMLADKMEEYKF